MHTCSIKLKITTTVTILSLYPSLCDLLNLILPQIVEDYDLPDIRAMKSQYDAGKNAKIPLPMPTQKSPAIAAREREKNEKKQQKAENLGKNI